jgi:predicted phosphate transport protein (TIGR00153 family)
MGLKEWLLPKDKIFFELLGKESEKVLEAIQLVDSFITKPTNAQELEINVKKLENQCDDIVHQIYENLNTAFITPIDHEDIGKLTHIYDDVLDLTYGVAKRLYLFNIKPSEIEKKFSKINMKCAHLLKDGFISMIKLKHDVLTNYVVEINSLEEEADELLNESVADLFKTTDPISIIKLKEIYEVFELITDKCEDVVTLMRDIVIKHA